MASDLSADFDDARSTAGGIGVLMDLAGDDRYVAQVFAQGTGFQEGLGLLVDDGGGDQFEAAWYAMGAAAHGGSGTLRESFLNLGLFMDLGGMDAYPAQCARARNDSAWATPRAWAQLRLRSEAGAGFDGVAPLPLAD